MITAVAWIVLIFGALLIAAAQVRRWSLPVWLSVLIGLSFRGVIVLLAVGRTPNDVRSYFQRAGHLVAEGKDPLTHMKRNRWNFLPLMPYTWAALQRTGLDWEVAVKILPVAADLVTIGLVFLLAPRLPRLRAFQYAVNPLALLVTCWHGQVEPVAIALGLGALLASRRHPGVGGGLLGLAVSAKSWPILFAVGAVRNATHRLRVIMATLLVPALFFFTMPLVLHAHMPQDARIIFGYRSLIGSWGWTSVVRVLHSGRGAYGYMGPLLDREARLGTLLTLLVVGAVIAMWRRADGAILMMAVLLAFLVVTAGFGVQYLMWPLPLLVARPTWRSQLFVALAGAFAALSYLPLPLLHTHDRLVLSSPSRLMLLSLAVIASAVLAMPWEYRTSMRSGQPESGGEPQDSPHPTRRAR